MDICGNNRKEDGEDKVKIEVKEKALVLFKQ